MHCAEAGERQLRDGGMGWGRSVEVRSLGLGYSSIGFEVTSYPSP